MGCPICHNRGPSITHNGNLIEIIGSEVFSNRFWRDHFTTEIYLTVGDVVGLGSTTQDFLLAEAELRM